MSMTPAPLAIRSLTLTNFRNYRRLALELPAAEDAFGIVLTGENGAGKTNLLEAVSLLVPGRGLRGARIEELPNLEAGAESAWGIAAEVDGRLGAVTIGTGQEAGRDRSQNKRAVRIQRQPVTAQAALADHMVMAWLVPAMDGLFREGTSERRRFVDRLAFSFDAGHAGRLTRYEKLLRERSKLLKTAAEQGKEADAAWLDSLEAGMAETGTAIAAGRLALVERMNRVTSADLEPFPAADLELDGTPEKWLAEGLAAGEVEDRLRHALARSRRDDAQSGGAGAGPHRSDLLARHRGRNMPAHLCSTGEQKGLLLAMVLAHARLVKAEIGAAPVLLLDEVAAHLDQRRREALFKRLAGHGAQVWMTGTDANVFNILGSRAQYLKISGGTVQKGA
jgi:DNA replication and repair protein RecF